MVFWLFTCKAGLHESRALHAGIWCESYRVIPRSAPSLHSRWMGGEERPKRRESPLFWRSNRRTLSHAHTHIIMKGSLTQNWPYLTMMEGTDGFLKVNWWQAPIRFQRQCECPVGMPDNLSKIRHIILPPRSVSLPQRKWLYAAGNYPKMTMRKGSAEIGEALRQARRHLANSGKESQITTKSWLSSSSSQSRPWSRTRNIWGPIWLIHSPILFTCY